MELDLGELVDVVGYAINIAVMEERAVVEFEGR